MKRIWKTLFLVLALAAGGAAGFLAAPAEAAGCPKICCPETGRCTSCFPGVGGNCLCPDIACP